MIRIIGDSEVQVRSVSNLEVLAHEVQCGHCSAVFYVNDDHLFSKQARE